jgi:hypothetical protein
MGKITFAIPFRGQREDKLQTGDSVGAVGRSIQRVFLLRSVEESQIQSLNLMLYGSNIIYHVSHYKMLRSQRLSGSMKAMLRRCKAC